jgi:hypothetical protein
LEFVKRATGIFSGLWKLRDWAVSMDQHLEKIRIGRRGGVDPPKRKKNLLALLAMLA